MNRKRLQASIRSAFDAPLPERKNGFLSALPYPKATRLDFLLAQCGYIRKRVWCVTLLVMAPALAFLLNGIPQSGLDAAWLLSSLLPFLVLAGMAEIARSTSFHMAEMEAGCTYSFSDVVLARLVILGGADAVLFAVILAGLRRAEDVGVLRLGVYLFVPFLLTCSLSLLALNRFQAREGVNLCGVIAGLVCIGNAILTNQYRGVYADDCLVFWGAAFFLLLITTIGGVVTLIKRTGDLQWNLSLTV